MIQLLIVDDEPEIREGIKQGIDWAGLGVNVCGSVGNVNDALDRMEELVPDIVILDIQMPEMDGLELLEILHGKFPDIKVILISGYDDFHYAQQAISLNAFCYLLKPLDPEILASRILEAGDMITRQAEKLRKDAELNRKLKENLPILRDNFFSLLVGGKLPDMDEINEKAAFLGINIAFGEFAVLILDIENMEARRNTDTRQKNLLKFAVVNCAEKLLKEVYQLYSSIIEENIVLLLCSGKIENEMLMNLCSSVKRTVNNSLGLSMSIGVGNVCPSASGISTSYLQALEALKYRLIAGKNEIIAFHSIPGPDSRLSGENSADNFLRKSHEDLSIALRSGSSMEVKDVTDRILQSVQKAIASDINAKNWLIFRLASSLADLLFSFDMRMEKYFGGDHDLYNELKRLQTMDELKDYIASFLDGVMEELEKRRKKYGNNIINKALDYIEADIHRDISLSSLADRLYIHPNYLSKLFRQELGESYMEYVTGLKMEKARQLLEDGAGKVYEIAESLSYKDVSHFIKVFKKTFGLSPSEYREIHSNSHLPR